MVISSENKIQLSSQQEQVVSGAGNIVVVAGAGTGKTETLTQRIVYLLTHPEHPARLHEITALTFTDKAAAEMRRRVYQGLLKNLVSETDPEKRARLEELRAGFAEANRIGTFDAWHHRLLATYPEHDLLPTAFRAMSPHDERELKKLLTRAFWNWCESLQSDDRDDLFYLLDRYERSTLVNLIERMAGEEANVLQELTLPCDETIFRDQIRNLAAHFAARQEKRETRTIALLWQAYEQRLPAVLPPALSGLLTDSQELARKDSTLLTQKHSFKVNWRKALLKNEPQHEALLDELESEALPLLGKWRDACWKLQSTLDAMRDVGEQSEADWQAQEILRRLAKFALRWSQERAQICRRRGWAAFQDIQRGAWQLLQEQPEVIRRLREATRYILVDEFQDTNRAQWKFVDAFRREDNVLLVGDGKQAIYGFRGGDITVFENVRAHELDNVAVRELSISRRSTPAVVEFCNRVFQEILPAPDAEKEEYEAAFQELQTGREDGEAGSVKIIRAPRDAVSESAGKNGDVELLADAVAEFLRALQDDADDIRAGSRPTRQPEYSSISARLACDEAETVGVLFRTHERKAVYENALRARGVRYASVKGIGFFATDAVAESINLLRFLSDENDEIALAGILRSPLAGLSDRALLELKIFAPRENLWDALQRCSRQNSQTIFAREADRRALETVVARLQNWKDSARWQRASEVLEAIWTETETSFSDTLHADYAQRGENRCKILDIIREREAQGQGSARALAEYFVAARADDERDSEAALPEGGAIQLMTIFAAKGLGFPMTIVAELDGVPRADTDTIKKGALMVDAHTAKTVFSLKPKTWEHEQDDAKQPEPVLWTILRSEENARRYAEFRRLLYVACTRAADHLVLAFPEEISDGTWAALLAPFVEGMPEVTTRQSSAPQLSLFEEPSTPSQELQRAGLNFDLNLLKPLPGDMLPRHASVSDVVRKLRGTPAIAASTRLARARGNALHRLLASAQQPDEARARSVARWHELPEEQVEVLMRQWCAALNWLRAKNFDAASARREIGFRVPATALQGVLASSEAACLNGIETLSGKIDLMLKKRAESDSDVWAIVDFKSHSGDEPIEVLAARRGYDLQLRFYRAAASHLGFDVRETWLVTLDDNGTARELLCGVELEGSYNFAL